MTEKLKCPFCGAELQEFGGGDFLLLHYCDNINCNLYHIMGQYTLWQELIRTRKALDKALHYLDAEYYAYIMIHKKEPELIAKVLAEIKTALEQKDK